MSAGSNSLSERNEVAEVKRRSIGEPEALDLVLANGDMRARGIDAGDGGSARRQQLAAR